MITSLKPIVWLLGAAVVVACVPDSSTSRITEPARPPLQGSSARQRLPHAEAQAALAAVLAGNQQAVASAPALVPPGRPLAPFIEARLYSIANLAVHDALNRHHPAVRPLRRDGGRSWLDANAAAACSRRPMTRLSARPGRAGSCGYMVRRPDRGARRE